MNTQIIKGYIVYETWNGEATGVYKFQTCKAIKDGKYCTQVPVCEHAITFDVPEDFDPRPAQIEALRAKKREAQAAFAVLVKELDQRINSLLAIENTVDA